MGVSAGSGTSMAEEITDEFANAELKDLRRNRRLDKVVTALAKTPAASISAASGGWGETLAAYRLLHCSAVTSSALIAPASGGRGATLCAI
jgi:hypothetical protein